MKNIRLMILMVLVGLASKQAVAQENYTSNFFKIIYNSGVYLSEAVKTIFKGEALQTLDVAETYAQASRENPYGVALGTAMLLADNPQQLQKLHDIRVQAAMIYGLGAVTAGSLGLTALYTAYKTGGVKRLAAGSVGALLTAAGAVAAYRITQL